MNEELKEIKKFWVMLATYYRQSLENFVVVMYAEDCKDVTVSELKWAFEQYRVGPHAQFFPLPATLLNLIRPPISDTAEAQAVVQVIMHCLSPFKPAEVAREYMGELAWGVVRAMGGWRHFGDSPPPNSYVQKQMLEVATALIVRARQGRADEKPSIHGSDRPQIQGLASSPPTSTVSKLAALASDALKGKELK